MTVTHYHTDETRLVKWRALAYDARATDAAMLDTPNNERAGAGGVFTNVRDLLQVGRELLRRARSAARTRRDNSRRPGR